jgi:hypothetical protein
MPLIPAEASPQGNRLCATASIITTITTLCGDSGGSGCIHEIPDPVGAPNGVFYCPIVSEFTV